MVKHPWPLLEICLSDFRRLAMLNMITYLPSFLQILQETSKELGIPCHDKGTAITIEGPRFSTKPESKFYQSLDASVIGMTLCPEVFLAKEAGLCYAAIAMVTDYDTWKEDAEVSLALECKVSGAILLDTFLLELLFKVSKFCWIYWGDQK